MKRRALLVLGASLVAGCAASPTAPSPPPSAAAPAPDAAPVEDAARTPGRAGPGPERLAVRPPLTRPAQPVLEARMAPLLVADHCIDRDLVAPPAIDAVYTILDRSYALPASYAPADLVPAAAAGFVGASAQKLVRQVIVSDLSAMRAAWDAEGLTIEIESAYRSYADQAATFGLWAGRLGAVGALLRTARPGHSEHQLGTALDLTSPGWSGRVGDWATESAEGAWMAEHGWEYGFVMSYPAGSQAATCFGYEPWHYRWIGREAAAEQRASGLYLRQFLERYAGD